MGLDSGIGSVVALLLVFAVYGLPFLAVVWVIRALRQARRPDPRAVLAERLARGEITRDEFDTAMRALGLPDPRG
jgi:uncharacterized membrane protein